MIYSLTLFGDAPQERELLKIRLAEELPYIDKFMIVESSCTHAGVSKPYGLKEMPELFTNPKIDCQFIAPALAKSGKALSRQQDRKLLNTQQIDHCRQFIKDDDIVICSDLDEINDRRDMPRIIDEIKKQQYIHIRMYNHQYYINYFAIGWQYRWSLSYGCTGEYLRKRNLTLFRLRHEWQPIGIDGQAINFVETTGHHFSYIMTADQIIKKIERSPDMCFYHNDYTFVDQAIKKGYDVLKRSGTQRVWSAQAVDNRYPKSVIDNMQYWQQWVIGR